MFTHVSDAGVVTLPVDIFEEFFLLCRIEIDVSRIYLEESFFEWTTESLFIIL